MFLTFDSAQPSTKDKDKNRDGLCNPKQPTARRSERLHRRRRHATVRACTSCRQRKIKCDGLTPCEACRWYKKAEQCRYLEREHERQTQNGCPVEPPARADYRGALARLFPEVDPDSIVGLSQEKLLSLLSQLAKPADGSHVSQSQPQDVATVATVATSSSVETHASALSLSSPMSLERPGLETLHSIPEQQHVQGDGSKSADAADASDEHIADDVNALSLPARHLSSYLGVSSMQAALKVLAWLRPELNTHLSLRNNQQLHSSHSSHSSHSDRQQPTRTPGSQTISERQLLDAYFANFQPFAPLIDEATCRATFLSGHRKDDRWLALFNILLALGSITAAGVDNNHDHRTYFARSMRCLNFCVLGNPSLEAIQTLGLMGGWYCHYISQPNLAYALMGAALRMAVTLGLQHEPPPNNRYPGYQEHKRRIWWSLCCLETWGQETLGRPSMDFFGAGITVKLPQMLDKENYMAVLPLVENVHFVKIASKIQQSLTALPTLTHADMLGLDDQLLQWWTSLPPVLKDYVPCPEALYAARTVMRWRFYNQRLLLYRPKLLHFAMCRIPLMAIKDEERIAVQRCGDIARVAIEDIAATTALDMGQTTQENHKSQMGQMSRMIAWNAVWMIFQATVVPLILLAAASVPGADDDAEACKAQVQTAMAALDRMRPYVHTAERSLGMVSGILEMLTGATTTTDNDLPLDAPDALNGPLMVADSQQVPQERVLDWNWTAATAGSQQMWDYLSWAENGETGENEGHAGNNDFWQDLYSSLNPQQGAGSMDAWFS
ncbi:hypothetical protein SBRCBS47491_009620 [Sporothrix bragantina]|uniref:Zn(2)-C6 fungal-type domain-containing protein n=1 Tax=Sporothrix bragantina TaxID=671064 RepID=A0ABP0CZF0_9PEZI